MKNKFAVVFPGQGSQRIGMLSELAKHYPLVEKTFTEASSVLGYDLWHLVQYGPYEELNKTYHAQPAILTASVAVWRIWQDQSRRIPVIMAGHSLGEYSALVCAGSISLSSAVKLVSIRGNLMQQEIPYKCGAMSVIVGLNSDLVCEFCKTIEKKGYIVEPAGLNAPKYTVISGHIKAVSFVNDLCKNAGAKYAFFLPISVPSHCVLMKPIAKSFKKELCKIAMHVPFISVINNTDVCIEQDLDRIRDALVRQLYTPVRWQEIIQYCINQKIKNFLEMGPGSTLTKFAYEISHDIFSISINNVTSMLKAIQIDWN